jgi:hypothetical protein
MVEKSEPVEAPKKSHSGMKMEMEAITGSLKLFEKLSLEGQQRAFSYLGNVLGLSGAMTVAPIAKSVSVGSGRLVEQRSEEKRNIEYGSLAELYSAARPETSAQKVLVGGFWCQVCQGLEEFSAQLVNDQLKEIGAKVGNVTMAFNTLKAANPSLVLQVRKSGKSKQSRKQYKLTIAGIRSVEDMIARE